MKDLTHYFVDNVKNNGDSVIKSEEEVTPEKLVNGNCSKNIVDLNVKKRERVKIKISQSNSRGKICNIVNSKNDLIDKTPSPHTKLSDKTIIADDTPKRSNSSNKMNDNSDINNGKIDLNSSDECIFEVDKNKKSSNNNNKIIRLENKKNNSPTDDLTNGREESNAFHVLMTRNKSGKINPTKRSNEEEEEDPGEIKNSQETKNKLKQNKEKLIALADKKGYSKRKIREREEEEKIEKQIENRIKMFKGNNSSDSSDNVITPKITPRGLYNYFSTITPEEREKSKSKMVVEAEIHGTKISLTSSEKSSKSNYNNKNNKSRVRKILATIDDIQVINSETTAPTDITPTEKKFESTNESSQSLQKKRKWSLRINLQSSETHNKSDGDSGNEVKNKTHNNHSKRKKSKKINKSDKEESTEDSQEEDEISNIKDNSQTNSKVSITTDSLQVKEASLDDSELEIIETKILKRPPNEKLAPLFVKRSKPDPDVVAARRSFLHSRTPENEKKKFERKVIVPGTASLSFPSISHIDQLSIEEKTLDVSCPLKYKIKETAAYTPVFNFDNFKSIINLNVSVQEQKKILKNDVTNPDTEEILKEIEGRCSDAREMWSKINSLSNKHKDQVSPKKRGRKRKSVDKVASVNKNNNENNIWTEKYKPVCTKEIVGNEGAAAKLRDWLNGWQSSSNKDDYSSGEEFYSSDNSRSGGLDCNQVAVLLGPHGSGKTASVYAIAEELGYNVLEVNASSKRPGRKILKDLEEATKSHHVKKSEKNNFLQPSNDCKKTLQNSLILFEDVDIIFDEDDGFISATYQLASNTKRPIVMTCRDSCSHLSRMAPQQLRISYQTIYGSRVSALLELITLAESGTRLPQPCLNKLMATGDLRKAILQLQYLLISGTPRSSLLSYDFHKTLWQDMRNYLYKPIIKQDKKQTKKKINLKDEQKIDDLNLNTIGNLADDLDAISLVSSLVDIDDEIINMIELKYEPSLSLEETMDLYSSNNIRSMEIGKWLRHKVMNKYTADTNEIDSKFSRQLSLKKELNTGINSALSQISINNLDSRSVSIDYLPAIRTICRSEEIKSTNNTKRRFFHYLQNFRLPYGSIKPNILEAACKAMQEKPDKSLQR